jgi:hypothetical protein
VCRPVGAVYDARLPEGEDASDQQRTICVVRHLCRPSRVVDLEIIAMTVDKLFVKRAALSLALGLGIAGSFYAGVAYAADARLDSANAHIIKADARLMAASNPNHRPFGGHRSRAVRLLERAEHEIALAKKYADSPHHHGKKPKAKSHKDKAKGKSASHGKSSKH